MTTNHKYAARMLATHAFMKGLLTLSINLRGACIVNKMIRVNRKNIVAIFIKITYTSPWSTFLRPATYYSVTGRQSRLYLQHHGFQKSSAPSKHAIHPAMVAMVARARSARRDAMPTPADATMETRNVSSNAKEETSVLLFDIVKHW